MTWQCRLVLNPPLDARGYVDIAKMQVGDMWYIEVDENHLWGNPLSAQYFAETRTFRRPIRMMLPGKHGPFPFLVDGQCFKSERGYYGGWHVTGIAPHITVHPSINIQGQYHGWLKNGIISDPLP